MNDAATHFATSPGGMSVDVGRHVDRAAFDAVEILPGLRFQPLIGTPE
ncbi:hypothetical protein GCM10010399_07910 [Dactylosporangium fulvum]|uniref:Uncharacterized protein n=1 Tax=Dactylosporangium fulvum TaxID=53359 RepID=A0ABY5WC07_9ACTN|nr:hypothetical protein [Dactylosporangium fulvum]UWP86564.1 hypothetical protein Dfulv_20920 [Dactylosporangium fulvum]